MEENEKREIEIVTGNGSELNISPVRDHIKLLKPKSKDEERKREIVIPEIKSDSEESSN